MSQKPGAFLRSQLSWSLLTTLLGLESLLLGWVTFVTLQATVLGDGNLGQNLSLVIMAAITLGWVFFTMLGSVRSRASWVRGSSLTIHVLLFAAGTGCLQFAIGPWQLGFALIAVALVGFFAAVLAKPVAPAEAETTAEAALQ